jgi:monoamine oxidase
MTTFCAVELDDNDDRNRNPIKAVAPILRVKVAIVGAGAAGLQCAHDLLTRHVNEGNDVKPEDIVILEARNRIGGRIFSTNETRTSVTTQQPVNFVVDHGAAWIHGTGDDDEVEERLLFPNRDIEFTASTTQSASSSSSIRSSSSSATQSSARKLKNPMMVLFEQVTPDGESVFGTHVKPIFCGNPWMRPEYVLHNHNEIVLFLDGKRLESNSPLINRALLRHFDILDQVSDIGDDMFEKGLGVETARTSLQETITMILTTQKQKELSEFAKGGMAKADAMSPDGCVEIDNVAVERVANFYQHLMECWFGCPSNHLPLADFVEDSEDESIRHDERYTPEGDFPGPHCVVRSGMKTLLQPLLQDGVESCIRLQKAVTRITQLRQPGREDGDHGRERNPTVELQTSDGLVVHADCCVLSIPLGCLQHSIYCRASTRRSETSATEKSYPALSFEPALSDEKCEAIHALRMGCYKKVFLTFDRIFWPPKQSFMGLIRSDCGSSVNSKRLGNYLLFDNLWARDGIPCLEAILISQAGEWSIGKDDTIIRDAVLEFLQDALDLAGKNVFDWCKDCHITRWEEDVWSCGAYSSFAVGALERHADALAQTEWIGQLIFCGEATFSEFEGSVHAALMSGERAAESVHDFLFSNGDDAKGH